MEYLITDGAILVGWLFAFTGGFVALKLIRKLDRKGA